MKKINTLIIELKCKVLFYIFLISILILAPTSTANAQDRINSIRGDNSSFLNNANVLLHKNQNTKQDSNVTLIGRWANGPCYAIEVKGNLAFFGNGSYLEIVDFSDPSNPIEKGKYLLPSSIRGISVGVDYVYVACGGNGLRIINISNLSKPTESDFMLFGNYIKNVTVSGNLAYVADGQGLHIIDISDPSNINEVGFLTINGLAEDVGIYENYAYVTDSDRNVLHMIDISNSSNPIHVGFFKTSDSVVSIAINGSYAFITSEKNGYQS